MVADLDSDTNKRETLIVYLPKDTLTTQVEYVMQLTATLNGNPKVMAAVETHFFVVSQPLVYRKLAEAGGGILNATGEEEARLKASRQAQRERMMSLNMEVWADLLPKTTDTITRVAELMASVGQSSAELTAVSRTDILALGDSLVARTRKPAHASSLAGSTGSSAISLLSSSGELSSGYMVSNVTSISLYNGTSEDDVLLVHGLEEAFTFTLAFRVPATHDRQARSDKVAEMDSQMLEHLLGHVIDALSGESSLRADDSDRGNIADADADINAQCVFFHEASRGAYEERQGATMDAVRGTAFDGLEDADGSQNDDNDVGGNEGMDFLTKRTTCSSTHLHLQQPLEMTLEAEADQDEGQRLDSSVDRGAVVKPLAQQITRKVSADDHKAYNSSNSLYDLPSCSGHASHIIFVDADAGKCGLTLSAPSPPLSSTNTSARSTGSNGRSSTEAKPWRTIAHREAANILLATIMKDLDGLPHATESGMASDIHDHNDFNDTSNGIGVTESYTTLQRTDGNAVEGLVVKGEAHPFIANSAEGAVNLQSHATTYPLSETGSLRAQHSAMKDAEPVDAAVELRSTWANKNRASIVGSIAARYRDTFARSHNKSSQRVSKLSVFKQEIRVLNARALFQTIKISVFRLQFCIPLNYLEQLALDKMDSLDASNAAAEVQGNGGREVGASTSQAVTEAMAGVAIQPISHAPDADDQQSPGTTEITHSASRALSSKKTLSSKGSLLTTGSSSSLKSIIFWKSKGLFKNMNMLKTSVSMDQLKRHQSSRKSVSSVVARHIKDACSDDEEEDDDADDIGHRDSNSLSINAEEKSHRDQRNDGKLSGVTSRRSAGQWQKRHLPVERMLGTALKNHEKRIADMYAAQQLSQDNVGNKTQSFVEKCGRGLKRGEQAMSGFKTFRASFKRSAVTLAKAHPVTAIFMVSATEPFTRSDRILVQANTFICMLLFAVWFFYSKAVNCCRELRTHLSCPSSSSDVNAPCLGFPTCAALAVGEHDRLWMVLIMIGIITPLTITLSNLFIMHANANIPKNWEIRQVPKKNVAGVGTTTAVLQTALLMLYAIFFKFEKMNKAIAVTFVTIFKTIIKTIIELSAYVQAILASSLSRCLGAREANKVRNRFDDSQGPPLLAELNGLGSLTQANMQHVAYCIIAVLWLTIAWTLFTYSMLLRDMMSIKTQNEFFAMWATAFGVGMFGVETMQIILIQIFASIVGDKIHMLFADIDQSMLWFEKFIQSKMSMEDAALDDNRQNDDDAGDQDMGDDADAFG
eukprot:gene1615-2252_t